MAVIKIVPMPGVPGPRGEQGPRGYQGDRGLTGPQGEPGPAGQDANTGDISFAESTMSSDYDMNITVNGVPGDITLSAYNGVVLGFADTENAGLRFPDGTIQTTAYEGNQSSTVVEMPFTVAGGSLGTPPTFNGQPLFTGSYVKNGPLVSFQIQVEFDNITNFGTGQYYVDLPFASKYAYQFRNGCIHDYSTGKQWAITGHVAAGESRMLLFYTAGSGQDEVFDFNSPFTLDHSDNFHIAGNYIDI